MRERSGPRRFGPLVPLAILFLAIPAQALKTKFQNTLSLQPTYYFRDLGNATSMWTRVIRDEPEFSVKTASGLKWKLAPWFYADVEGASASERGMIDLNEANVDWRPGDWTLLAGFNRLSWGVTDFYNPLDIVNARRYLDPLNSEKRGVPSLDLGWESDGWRFEAVYVPVQVPALLPGENSRWLPRDLFIQGQFQKFRYELAPEFRYTYADARVEDDALHNNFGFRLEHHGSGLDLSAVFFQGAPTAPAMATPVVDTRTDPADINHLLAYRIVLEPTYYLRRTAGVGAVITLETLILRLAVADSARVSENSALPGWSHGAVAGAEKNFAIGASTLTALLQGTLAESEQQAGNTVASLDRIFDRSWLLGLRLATSGAWTYQSALLLDTLNRGWYALARAEVRVADGCTGSLQGDWFDGETGTPIGTYRRNERLTLGLGIYF